MTTILAVVAVLCGYRLIVLLNRKEAMRPTPEEVSGAYTRMRGHMMAVSGEQSVDAFCDSPYFRSPSRGRWHWEEDMMRMDSAILAAEYVCEHEEYHADQQNA